MYGDLTCRTLARALLARVEQFLTHYWGLRFGVEEAQALPDSTQILAHFTKLEVALKILETNDLWLRHFAYQNDIREQSEGLEALAFGQVNGPRPEITKFK